MGGLWPLPLRPPLAPAPDPRRRLAGSDPSGWEGRVEATHAIPRG